MAGPIKVNVAAVNQAASSVKTLAGGLESGLAQLAATAQHIHGLLGAHQSGQPFEAEWKREVHNNRELERDLRALSDILVMVGEGFTDSDNRAANSGSQVTAGAPGSVSIGTTPLPTGGAPITGATSPGDPPGVGDTSGSTPAAGSQPGNENPGNPTGTPVSDGSEPGSSTTGSTATTPSGSDSGSAPGDVPGNTPASTTSTSVPDSGPGDTPATATTSGATAGNPVLESSPVSARDLGQTQVPSAPTISVPVPHSGVLGASTTTSAGSAITSGGISVGAPPDTSVGVPVTGGAVPGGLPATAASGTVAAAGSNLVADAAVLAAMGGAAAAVVPALKRKRDEQTEEGESA